jgi:hypothetical protein
MIEGNECCKKTLTWIKSCDRWREIDTLAWLLGGKFHWGSKAWGYVSRQNDLLMKNQRKKPKQTDPSIWIIT